MPGLRYFLSFCLGLIATASVAAADGPSLEGSTLLATKGRVELTRSGAQVGDSALTNAVLHLGDQIRTFESSRATLRLRDATIVNVNELTTLRIASESGRSVIDFVRGMMSFFHRDRPGDTEVRGGTASAIIRGTEFVVSMDANQKFSILLLEGSVDVTNQVGSIRAQSGDEIVVKPNEAPAKSPSLVGGNKSAIQWTIYYPAVLDPAELTLDAKWNLAVEQYRGGDLWQASETARALGAPASDSERVFLGALRLAVGDVGGLMALVGALTGDAREARLASALQDVVRAVQFEPCPASSQGAEPFTTELLSASYCLQSQGKIPEALAAARKAAAKAPRFGFALERVAELEFASGNVAAARAALREALNLSPRLASAVALDGFLLAARGDFPGARRRFDEAIALDAGLADAWLGRGLVRFHQGDRVGGRVDMEAAAAIEPQRSVLRSYLGKAFAEEGSEQRALAELALAERLDQKDPTALLYSALIRYRQYDLTGAIRDLEESSARNANRSVFRSRMLLDQDAAVRSANLANIYDLADLSDVARRESARAVMSDYANYSAHLNLASSFNALRDPTRFNLRNETVWFNEHLLASLLAPTGAAPLSQNLSQNEYSRLFARDQLGFSSTTEIWSHGEQREVASQSGNFENISYALDLDSAWREGERPNQDLARVEWYTRAKISVTPADSLFFLTKVQDYESGDNFQYANPAQARPFFRFQEKQTPMALAGFHHEWNPGSHTLFLGGRLESAQTFSDQSAPQLIAFSFPASAPASGPFNVSYENEFVTYTAELNHILQAGDHTTILGGRYQNGQFKATADLDASPLGAGLAPLFGNTTRSTGHGDFQRGSVYLYHTWEILTDLRLTGGASFDDITSPLNFRAPPLRSGETQRADWSPKAALVYAPSANLALRGMYARSVGGVSYDESITLEPTQLAGFAQAFRTLISESLVGSVEVPRYNLGGFGLDFKFPTETYVSIEGTVLDSDVDREIGYFDYDATRVTPGLPSLTPEQLRYEERGVRLAVSQILAQEWFANAGYQFTRAELDRTWPTLPAPAGYNRTQSDRSDLHRLSAAILYQRRDGWFGRGGITWLHQENINPNAPASEEVPQLNLFVGWRFPRFHGDITVGLVNVTDSNYRLHPLTPYEEFPRERTFYLRFQLKF